VCIAFIRQFIKEKSALYRYIEVAGTNRYKQRSVRLDVSSKSNVGWLSGDRLEECAYLKKKRLQLPLYDI
jgi:hypothetical protein